jgi:hypothetical protein
MFGNANLPDESRTLSRLTAHVPYVLSTKLFGVCGFVGTVFNAFIVLNVTS